MPGSKNRLRQSLMVISDLLCYANINYSGECPIFVLLFYPLDAFEEINLRLNKLTYYRTPIVIVIQGE